MYYDTWNALPTNKKVAVMFPNSVDGNAYREYFTLDAVAAQGFEMVDAGAFQPMTEDFTTAISLFKKEGCEICSCLFLPPEMANFWNQCLQQGFNPKIFQAVKGTLVPTAMEATGASGDGVSGTNWFHPTFPYVSSLTGETCQELCDDFKPGPGSSGRSPSCTMRPSSGWSTF